jgi:regulator of sigma E protease
MGALIFILILIVLVLVHEWGHYITAIKYGVKVMEFGFGFPPKAKVLGKRGDTEFTLNWIPFGGFVRIFGEDPNDKLEEGEDKKKAFYNQSHKRQIVVLSAGVACNFLLAILLFTGAFSLGVPVVKENLPAGYDAKEELTITGVEKESVAELSGVLAGDRIVSVFNEQSGIFITDPNTEEFLGVVRSSGDENISLGLERKGKEIFVDVTPKVGEQEVPRIGVSLEELSILKLPVHKAFIYSVGSSIRITGDITLAIANLIGDAVTGKGSLDGLSGPVGIANATGEASSLGFSYILILAAILSLNLAIVNLLPFPALDGGRIVIALFEGTFRKKAHPGIVQTANTIGFLLLIGLMILITWHDIKVLF